MKPSRNLLWIKSAIFRGLKSERTSWILALICCSMASYLQVEKMHTKEVIDKNTIEEITRTRNQNYLMWQDRVKMIKDIHFYKREYKELINIHIQDSLKLNACKNHRK